MWTNRKRVLGMNERNLTYIKRYNSARAKRIADDKLLTKKILTESQIPTPKLIGSIENFHELINFDWNKLPKSFVIKPVKGLEGGGIEIFFNRDANGNWIKADGSRYSLIDVQNLAADIIDGKYSLHGEPDRVLFEERVKVHKAFKYYTYKGVPDIRIIVFNGVPVMSYVRLPTKESDGKGNLAQGAIGAAIDIATGVTTSAVKGKSEIIERIPVTNVSVSGLKIPYWERILTYSVAAQKATGLNFAAIDFLIDRDHGPMIVELNARPGLSIQIANQDGLRWRLRKVRGIKVKSVEKGVRLAKDVFGGEIEEDIERISGKSLIGIVEDVILHPLENNQMRGKMAKPITIKAKIDTGADSTSVDKSTAVSLGYGRFIEDFEKFKEELNIPTEIATIEEAHAFVEQIMEKIRAQEYPIRVSCESVRSSHGRSLRLYIEIDLTLGEFRYTTMANIYDRSNLTYKVIIGRRSLSRFLVEPSRKNFTPEPKYNVTATISY